MSIKSMESAFSLKGKNTIVTGGAKGIGLGIAMAFAQQGANVAIFARDAVAAKEAVDELGANYSGKFSYYVTDIKDMNNCKDSVTKFIEEHGDIDVLVNNAGIAVAGGLLSMDEDLAPWHECFDVDLNGGVRLSYLVCKHMRDNGKGGKVINITSNAGEMINAPFLTAYAAAKAAFNHLTRCLAAEVAPYNIQVNAIAPGFTFSNFAKNIPEDRINALCETIPARRFAQPIEIGALATYLASEASDMVTGQIYTIDGGYSLQH